MKAGGTDSMHPCAFQFTAQPVQSADHIGDNAVTQAYSAILWRAMSVIVIIATITGIEF